MVGETYLRPVVTTKNLSSGMVNATIYELVEIFAFGEKVIERYIGYGTPDQRTQTYTYCIDITANGYGKIIQTIDYDGSWIKYEYDTLGRVVKEVSPFGDATMESAENLCSVITYDYTKLESSESSDPVDVPRWRTKIVTVCGQETARKFRQYFTNHEVTIVATLPGAAYTDAGNKVTTTYFAEHYDYISGETIQRVTKVENPDGTSTENSYYDSSYTRQNPSQTVYTTQKTSLHKFLNNSLEREVELKNHFGTIESYRRYYLASGVEILVEGYDQTTDRNGRPLVKTDLDGNVTTYEYYTARITDGDYTNPIPFKHTRTTKPDGSVLVEAFDGWDDKIFELYDGIKTFYHYDVYGNVLNTVITGREGGKLATATEYNDDNVKVSEIDANGNVTRYTYGAAWNARTDAVGNVFRNEYFLDGRLKNTKVNGTIKNYYTYEIVNNELVTIEYVSTTEWSRRIIGFDGNIRQEIYPDGYVCNYSLDEYGRKKVSYDNCCNKTEYVYNSITGELFQQWQNGALTEFANGYAADDETGEVYRYERTFSYYKNSPVLTKEVRIYRNERKIREFNAGSVIYETREFSGNGIVIETKTENAVITTRTYLNSQLQSVQNAIPGLIEYVYDEFNRSIGYNYMENVMLKTIRYSLDNRGNVIRVTQTAGNDIRAVNYLYDSLHRKILEVTAEGQSVFYTYDAENNITSVVGNAYPQSYTYDLHGRMTSIITYRNPATPEITAFTYDNRGRMQSRIYPNNATEQFSYRGDGNLDCITNAREQVIRFRYDALNRLASIQGADVYWEFTYDYRNLLLRVCNGNYWQSFSYDAYGNLVGEIFSDTPNAGITYFRDEYKRFIGYSFDGKQVNYRYAPDTGVLSSIKSGKWCFSYNRVQGNKDIAETLVKKNDQTIQSINRVYNKLGELISIGNYGYTVNLDGRRENATLPDGKTWTYSYDNFNQVTAGVFHSSATPSFSHSYVYDTIGNRITSNDNGIIKNYTTNDLNQYTEINGVEYEYDADGNLLSDGRFDYCYNALNQLVSIATKTDKEVFIYDFMGRRIATESYFKFDDEWILSTKRRYIYWRWNVIAEYVNGIKNKTYIWGEDINGTLQDAGGVGGLLLEQNADGEYLPVYDGNGNIIAYKNDRGSTVSAYVYDPFGNIIAHDGMDFTYKFSTKEQDILSGMYYYGYRFYQPTIGRWISRDQIRELGGLNLFSTNNNLVSHWDVNGMKDGESALDVAFAGVKTGINVLVDGTKWAGDKVIQGFSWTKAQIVNGHEMFWNGINWCCLFVIDNEEHCGSENWQLALLSDSPFGFNFSKCCLHHDDCYEQPGCTKECCDEKFHNCMKKQLKDSGRWYQPTLWGGYAIAYLYFWGVYLFGGNAYRESQNKNRSPHL